jgi:hypothetical protein
VLSPDTTVPHPPQNLACGFKVAPHFRQNLLIIIGG